MLKKWAVPIIAVGLLVSSHATLAADATVVSLSNEYQHADSSGGQGRDTVKLTPPRTSGAECAVFDGADIVYKKRRYGRAEIVSKPKSGCSARCTVDVDWEHEPAGRLNYQIKVDWKIVSGC